MTRAKSNYIDDKKITDCVRCILENDGFSENTIRSCSDGVNNILMRCDRGSLYELAVSECPEKNFRSYIDELFPRLTFNKIGWYIAALRILCRAVEHIGDNFFIRCEKDDSKTILPLPQADDVRKILEEAKNSGDFPEADSGVKQVFDLKGIPNTDSDDMMKKISCLRDNFATVCPNAEKTADVLSGLNIHEEVAVGDEAAVGILCRELSCVTKSKTKLYYFATAFCSAYNPKRFPLCNSYSCEALKYYRDAHDFYGFSDDELLNYAKYKKLLGIFKRKYLSGGFSNFEISRFLTLQGKKLSEA